MVLSLSNDSRSNAVGAVTGLLPSLFWTLLATLVIVAPSHAQTALPIQVLDVPGAAGTLLQDINDAGTIVGSYLDPSDPSQFHAFVFRDGQFTTIDVPGAAWTQALGMNNAGDIVGSYGSAAGIRAFRLTAGQWTDISLPGAYSTVVYDIDATGTIIGAVSDTTLDPAIPFVQRPGQAPVRLPSTYLSGMNDAGVAVGVYFDRATFESFPFRYEGGQVQPVSLSEPGCPECAPAPIDISSNGSMVGVSHGGGGQYGFAMVNGQYYTVPVVGARLSQLWGVNAKGVVVGWYETAWVDGIPGSWHGLVAVVQSPVLVDPVPDLLNGASIATDSQTLFSKGREVRGVAADGVARVVMRIPASRAGEQITVRVLASQSPRRASTSPEEDGAVSSPGSSSAESAEVIAIARETSAGPHAFAVYRAPADFARRSAHDDNSTSREVYLEIQPFGGAAYAIPVTIVRPPVVLVHGLWSDWRTWDNFRPLVTGKDNVDERFSVGRVSYDYPLGVSQSNPIYPPEERQRVRGNAVGVAYNAPTVQRQMEDWLGQFKLGRNPVRQPVAAVQADVVGHSMGGLMARAVVAGSGYLSDTTFRQGSIHKLVSIGTPYLGSPIATRLLRAENHCVRQVFSGNGMLVLESARLRRSGRVVNGAVADLADAPLSAVLWRLSQPSTRRVPTSYIAGLHDSWTTLDSSAGARAVRALCGAVLASSPLASALTSTGWPALFGQASDGIVSRDSQLNGGIGGGARAVFSGFSHTTATDPLGLGAPSELDMGTPTDHLIVERVIEALNQPVYNSTYFTVDP